MCPERHLFPLFLGYIKRKGFFQWTDTGKQMSLQIVPSESTSARDTRKFMRDRVLVQATNVFPPRDQMLASTAFTISAGRGEITQILSLRKQMALMGCWSCLLYQ